MVRLNPVRHGVLAQTPVIPLVEKQEDWEELRAGVFEYLDAEGTLEEALADRVAGILWRLYRVVRFESESISRYLQDVPGDWRASRSASGMPVPGEVTEEVVAEMDRMLMARLLPGDETLDKIMRYETKLHRFLLQTLHQFMVVKGLKKTGGRYYGESEVNPPGFTQPRGPSTPSRVPKYVSGVPREKPGPRPGSKNRPANVVADSGRPSPPAPSAGLRTGPLPPTGEGG